MRSGRADRGSGPPLLAGCTILESEDMQDGQVIEGLTIRNPF